MLCGVRLSMTPWTIACQAPLSMGFFRQECWNRLPFPTPGNLPDPEIKPVSPVSPALAGRFCTTAPPGRPLVIITNARKECVDFTAREMTKCYRKAFTRAFYGNDREFQNWRERKKQRKKMRSSFKHRFNCPKRCIHFQLVCVRCSGSGGRGKVRWIQQQIKSDRDNKKGDICIMLYTCLCF